MVVARSLSEQRCQPDTCHSQRDSHTDWAPGLDPRPVERCHPQLLDSQPAWQARPDSLPRDHGMDSGGPPGSVPRAMCRILRLTARSHDLYVIAEPEDKFKAWMKQQLQPSAIPADPVKQRGQQVFLNYACVYCHQIRGTTAAGQNGPDLTHFGSRRGIAANTLRNNSGQSSGLDSGSAKQQAR